MKNSLLCMLAICVLAPALAFAQSETLDEPDEVVPPAPVVERAPETVDSERASRLDAWLELRAHETERDALLAGIAGIGGGALLMGMGVWMWADDAFGSATFGRPLMGSLTLALGGVGVGLGVAALVTAEPAVERLRRWREANERGLTNEDLARFEGELRAEADAARFARFVSMATSIGLAVGGGAILGLSLGIDGLSELDRIYGASIGGAYVAFGALMFGLSFIESPEETAWNRYQRDEGPQVSIQPVIGIGSLGVAGTF